MKKKFSVFRILLIVLGALMIVGFFAMPVYWINDAARTATEANEAVKKPLVQAYEEEQKEEKKEDDEKDADQDSEKEESEAKFAASHPLEVSMESTDTDAEEPFFLSEFTTLTYLFKLFGHEYSFSVGSILLLIALILLPLTGLLAALFAIIHRKLAYIGGLISGGLMLVAQIWVTVKAYQMQSDAKDFALYTDIKGVHTNVVFFLLLLVPVCVLLFAILGLIKDKGNTYDTGYDDQPYGPGDGYGPDYGNDGYGTDGYDPYGETGSYQDPYGGQGYGPMGQGALVGIKGEYLGATIPVGNGENVTIGRNPASSQVVIDNAAVSRTHCHVTYFADQNTYGVTDVSKFGVYDSTGSRLSQGQMTYLQPGDEIHIGRSHNVFRLQ